MRLVIMGRPSTAKNGMSVGRLPNGRMMSFKKPGLVKWEKDALRQITGDKKKHIDYPVNVAVKIWIMENRRCDLVGFLQAVDDMLVHAGVLLDDSGWHKPIVVSHDGSLIAGVDRKKPRIEIEITERNYGTR